MCYLTESYHIPCSHWSPRRVETYCAKGLFSPPLTYLGSRFGKRSRCACSGHSRCDSFVSIHSDSVSGAPAVVDTGHKSNPNLLSVDWRPGGERRHGSLEVRGEIPHFVSGCGDDVVVGVTRYEELCPGCRYRASAGVDNELGEEEPSEEEEQAEEIAPRKNVEKNDENSQHLNEGGGSKPSSCTKDIKTDEEILTLIHPGAFMERFLLGEPPTPTGIVVPS